MLELDKDHLLNSTHKDKAVIRPIVIDNEEVLFDADRDNSGKGITPDEMVTMLKKIRNEQNRKISKKA